MNNNAGIITMAKELKMKVNLILKNPFSLKLKGTLSWTFFDLFSKTAPKLRLSTFNHAGNAPRT